MQVYFDERSLHISYVVMVTLSTVGYGGSIIIY